MDQDHATATLVAPEQQYPRDSQAGADRRIEGERRRNSRGWHEMRARRDGIEVDRRRRERRDDSWWSRAVLAFWRREKV